MEPIKLKHLKNFRDLGGIETSDGRHIKKHVLIRGKALRKLTFIDVYKLKFIYNLKTIIDLRCDKEINESPDDIIDGVNYFKMPITDETMLGISHEKKIHSLKSLYEMPIMTDLYENLVSDKCLDNVIAVLKKILFLPENQLSVVFHCSAGKDRTGIISALLLSFLGVPTQTITQEYMYSNKINRVKAFFVYLGLMLIRGKPSFARKIQLSLLAKKKFLDSSFNKLKQEFGDMETFFAKALNLSLEEKIEIQNKFLE